ncbi:MAG: signal peptidase I [Eubacteriales bacterium]|nr:signal peptidase I [Eubacteriales bacterium]
MSNKGSVKGVLHKIFSALGIILCIVLIPILIVNVTLIVKSFIYPDEVPSFLGYKPFIVLSGSMEPVFFPGDMVLVKEVAPDTLEVGDIIAFRRGDSVITHRITDVTDSSGSREFVTKGDNNNIQDNFKVTPDMVEGIFLFGVAKIGNAAMFLQEPIGLVVFIALPLILFILYDVLRRQTTGKKESKRTKQLEAELELMRQQIASMGKQPESEEPMEEAAAASEVDKKPV